MKKVVGPESLGIGELGNRSPLLTVRSGDGVEEVAKSVFLCPQEILKETLGVNKNEAGCCGAHLNLSPTWDAEAGRL